MAQWYAGAVISRLRDNGVREYLVIDTRSVHPQYLGRPLQTKFCGGTEENHELEDKDILDTLRRETLEETDMTIRDDAVILLIHSENMSGHFKNFYDIAFEDLQGELRNAEKTIEGDWMSVPYWVTYEQACRLLYKSHQLALLKVHARRENVGA